MADRDDPLALRWLIGVELTNFRKRAGRRATEAAKVINCSPGKIGHLESGRNQQQPAEVTALLRYYGADLADIERLASLAGGADRPTWWAPWTDVVPDWLRTFVGLEGLASTVSDYATFAVPALLQTHEYSLAATVGGSRVRPDHAERVVGLRMDRQRRLDSEGAPLRLLALIEESVLDRPIGGPAVLRRQLEHLISQADRDNVEIRMLPTSVGLHDGGVGPFTLLDFAQAQSIAYIEIVDGALYVQDQAQVSGYTRTVASLRELALSPADTREAIRARLTALT
ncbi:MAG: helix-turn-helix domain-containing protein [Pseudonocardiales bacterium]|nr:helix-turn-helix domain-containing protein [Pseudonocardiales bacterium]